VATAETLRAEGFAEGRAEGFAEGVAEVLVYILTMNSGPVPENVAGAVHKTVLQAVRDISVDQFKVWMARLAAAETAEEMAEIFGWRLAAVPEPGPGARELPVADREEAPCEG
jgi:hypothetical protein